MNLWSMDTAHSKKDMKKVMGKMINDYGYGNR